MALSTNMTAAEKSRLHRQRLREAGGEEVLVQLPREVISLLDELKGSQKLRSRSQALMQLIEKGREATQQIS